MGWSSKYWMLMTGSHMESVCVFVFWRFEMAQIYRSYLKEAKTQSQIYWIQAKSKLAGWSTKDEWIPKIVVRIFCSKWWNFKGTFSRQLGEDGPSWIHVFPNDWIQHMFLNVIFKLSTTPTLHRFEPQKPAAILQGAECHALVFNVPLEDWLGRLSDVFSRKLSTCMGVTPPSHPF